jgi:EAL domain-containing protein (putative c-di-GMP-specific phosphodiesterase class I)
MLPIDRIKMDMQFVHGIEKSDKDKAITKVIINLAQNLGVKVVAEGVETEKQLQFLSMRMCDEVQGFFCYRPAPADEVETMLRQSLLEGKVIGAGM